MVAEATGLPRSRLYPYGYRVLWGRMSDAFVRNDNAPDALYGGRQLQELEYSEGL